MLTLRQRDCLHFIRDFIADNGFAPNFEEIADGLGIRSRGTVHRYVHALSKSGHLKLHPLRARGIELLEPMPHPSSKSAVPLLGAIAAGKPIEAIPGHDTFTLQDWFEPDCFALKVEGDSMIDAGIYDGDIVICRASATAKPSQVAVALIDQLEATLKYCKTNPSGTITLVPANSALRPQTYAADRVQIQGVVIGQFRQHFAV